MKLQATTAKNYPGRWFLFIFQADGDDLRQMNVTMEQQQFLIPKLFFSKGGGDYLQNYAIISALNIGGA
jgi:hypothetical protein